MLVIKENFSWFIEVKTNWFLIKASFITRKYSHLSWENSSFPLESFLVFTYYTDLLCTRSIDTFFWLQNYCLLRLRNSRMLCFSRSIRSNSFDNYHNFHINMLINHPIKSIIEYIFYLTVKYRTRKNINIHIQSHLHN